MSKRDVQSCGQPPVEDDGSLGPAELREMFGCVSLDVRRAMRAVTRRYDSALRPVGLRSTQLPILVAIALHPGVPVSELAAGLLLERSTLLRNLRPLVRDGLVEMTRCERDGRRRLLTLSPEGHQRVAAARPLWLGVQQQVYASLGPSFAGVRAGLEALRLACGPDAD